METSVHWSSDTKSFWSGASYLNWDGCFGLCYWWNPQLADFRWFRPMASGNLFLQKDNFGRNLVWDPQWWAAGNRWNVQDLEIPSEGLQAWSSCTHRPPQSLALYRYKKNKLQTSPLSSKVVNVPLSDWLLTEQS